MSQQISIDPFTRIEGHLAISLDVNDGRVTEAQCKGEMFRGFEQIMLGRSPMDSQQIMQRICGVCPVSQGLASVTAQEQAYGLELPDNAKLIRNIILAANYIQNTLTHFYHLSALDFMDTAGVLEYNGTDRFLLGLKDWVRSEMNSKKLYPAAPFLPKYEGQYLQGHEGNIELVQNYFAALPMRAKAHQLTAIWGGKMPHMTALVPGGMTEVVTTKKIALCRTKLHELRSFLENSHAYDVVNVMQAFPQYLEEGRSYGNYLSYGVFPDVGRSGLLFPAGTIIDGQAGQVDIEAITEDVQYSKYSSDSGFGKTKPMPDKSGAYSWIKAPRYKGKPMEVGPLARIAIAYQSGKDLAINRETRNFLSRHDLTIDQLDSCLGRHICRAIEIRVIVEHLEEWIEMLDPSKPTCADFNVPTRAQGVGLVEAPRGALGHWLEIEDKKVSGYECVVPTTWNCSPKDNKGVHGPVEKSLLGTAVTDAANPLEAARIVRAYDPCLACAVH